MRKLLKLANIFFSIVISAAALLFTLTSHARDLEITPFIGQMSSSDLTSTQDDSADLAVNGANNYGFAIAWQDSPKGQAQ